MTREEALQAVRAYVASCTGVALNRVRTGDADSLMPPAGTVFYVVRLIVDQEASGPPVVVYGDDAGDFVGQIHEWRALTFRIDGLGAGTDIGLQAVQRRYVAGVPAGDALRTAGVAPYRFGAVNDLSRLLQSGTMPRWTMTMDAYIAATDDLGVVDTVTQAVVDVTLERPAEVVAEFTVTVEP